MQWISFAWTLEPLLAGVKTVTRRDWKSSWAARFHKDDLVVAYDKTPYHGGKRVALLKLTHDPYIQNTRDLPEEDWINEGLAFMEENGYIIKGMHPAVFWLQWKEDKLDLWVIRFKLIGF